MFNYQEISEKIRGSKAKYAFINTTKKSLEDKISELENSKKGITIEKNKQDNILEAAKLVLEKLVHTSKTNIELFLTHSLKQIFVDRDYSILFNIKDDAKRPSLELTLVENGINQEITDAVGGGILSAIGLLLQIYYLEIYGLNKVMFIDEGLKEISTGNTSSSDFSVNYLQNTLNYLDYLSKNFGYKFIIITHDNNVRSIAQRIYEVKSGGVELCH